MPLGPSQDHVGPLASTVEDAALLYAGMAGVSTGQLEGASVQGLRIGLPENYFWEELEPDVRFTVRGAVQVIAALGALPREMRVPDIGALMDVARVTLLCEAAATLSIYNPAELGDDVRARVGEGQRITAVEYLHSQDRRRELAREFAGLWRDLDLLMMPTTPMTAYAIEADVDLRPATTRLTRPFNLLGWPAISLPCGVSSVGLPIGVQLVAAPGDEDVLFRAAAAIEAGVRIPIKKRK
jgi:aspartyl-tRNA(Asn)/glutamyl-tRNA(Gln) amidotransferase subunit A